MGLELLGPLEEDAFTHETAKHFRVLEYAYTWISIADGRNKSNDI